MCLITFIKPGGKPSWKTLKRGANVNSDGYGIMWHDGEKTRSQRSMRWEPIEKRARKLVKAGTACAIHQRFTTHGETSLRNCHPYRIPGHGSLLMHNGIISDAALPQPIAEGRSDTHAVADWAGGMPRGFESKKAAKRRLGKIAGHGKFVILDSSGQFHIINSSFGIWKGKRKVWYSNGNSFRYGSGAGSPSAWKPSGRYSRPTNPASYYNRYAEGYGLKPVQSLLPSHEETLPWLDKGSPYVVDLEFSPGQDISRDRSVLEIAKAYNGKIQGHFEGEERSYAWFGFRHDADADAFEMDIIAMMPDGKLLCTRRHTTDLEPSEF